MMLWVLLLSILAVCNASFPAQITPFAHARRQTSGDTCGYENANVLSQLTCSQGSSCAAQPSNNVAGGCCRLADSNCILATACVDLSALSQNCGSDCSTNSYVTKCSDSATPYCYTRYWISGAVTPSEVGCTTTQGYVAYAYSTYTGFGAEITPASVTSAIPTPSRSGSAVGAATASGSGSGGNGSSGSAGQSEASSGGGGGGPPAGAIAGGVVGGVAVLGIVAALIVWIVLRHRRQQKSKPDGGAGPSNGTSGVGFVPGNAAFIAEQKHASNSVVSPAELSQNDSQRPWELGGQKKHEVQGRSAVPELP